jgi:[protein-PII] uridylyltransferase
VLVSFSVNVHSARINTLGERAEDTFLITGEILNETRTVIRLETMLLEALRTSSETSGANPGNRH